MKFIIIGKNIDVTPGLGSLLKASWENWKGILLLIRKSM